MTKEYPNREYHILADILKEYDEVATQWMKVVKYHAETEKGVCLNRLEDRMLELDKMMNDITNK